MPGVTAEDAAASITAAKVIPVPMLHDHFTLHSRTIASAEEGGAPLDLAAAAMAGMACARMEDELVFQGNATLGIAGLLTAEGSSAVKLGDWNQVGQPAEDLIKAVNALDESGFPGPYAAALAPSLYNALLRLYPQTDDSQLEHARQILGGGIVKAPTLASGGVVLATGKQFASIVVGQDMLAAFVGPAGVHLEFVVIESLVPRITVPQAICVLE